MDQAVQKQSLWQRARHYIVYDILHANDTPHRLSLSVAIGTFVAFTPTMPFQMIMTLFLCVMFRANKAVGLPVVWVTNPATVIPIYLPQYLLGCFLLGMSPEDVDWEVLITDHGDVWAYSREAWNFMVQIFEPLWLGSVIISSILAVIAYYGTRILVVKYRMQRYGSAEVPPQQNRKDA